MTAELISLHHHDLSARQTITVNGVDLVVRDSGSGDLPLVLMHHYYGSIGTWDGVVARMAGEHRLIAIDRVGFGETQRPRRSEWRDRNPYTLEASVDHVLGVLDALGIDQAILVGSSAGGTCTVKTWEHAPERIAGIALVSPAIDGDVGPPAATRPILRTAPMQAIMQLVVAIASRRIDLDRITGAWARPERATASHLAPYMRAQSADGFARGIAERLVADTPPDLTGVLPTIRVPSTVVWGDSDRVIHARWNRQTAGAIPGARAIEIPDCGHTPQEERPDALVDILRELHARVTA